MWSTQLIKRSGGDAMAAANNGWNEYSKLVLEQLESLSAGIDALRDEMQEMRQEVAIVKIREDRVTELKAWKEKIDDVVSPTQMKHAFKEIEELKVFKTKAVTIFMVVQAIMGLILASSKMF